MDAIAEWVAAQARVIELVDGIDPNAAEQKVPACPAWSVRDLLAHLVGLDVDVLAGDEPDDHNSTWTQRQVDERADRDIAALIGEWRTTTVSLQLWMREHNTRPLGDVVIHEQDLRGALGVPGAKDNAGLAALRERFAGRFAQLVGDRPAVLLRGEDWQFVAGTGEPVVEVAASDFELARMVLARRSADQIRAATVRGDVAPYLDAFATLGPLPDSELTE